MPTLQLTVSERTTALIAFPPPLDWSVRVHLRQPRRRAAEALQKWRADVLPSVEHFGCRLELLHPTSRYYRGWYLVEIRGPMNDLVALKAHLGLGGYNERALSTPPRGRS